MKETSVTSSEVLAFGTGVFLRAFVCDFADRAGVAVTMVSSTSEGDKRGAQLNRRGGRFTLALRGIEPGGQAVDTWRDVRSIQQVLAASTQWFEVLATAHNSAINLVVSNVTESALHLSDDASQDQPNLAPPTSFPAKLARWLHERYTHFAGDTNAGVAILPCELVEENGALLRGMVEQLARRWNVDGGFVSWLESACVFADTLVDRIVPGAPVANERETLWRRRLEGEDDPLLTIAEPFALWAVRGNDVLAQRLNWLVNAGAGSVVVEADITSFALRKVRLLNGLHTAMASIAPGRYGLTTVGEAIAHSELGPFLRALLDEEIVPANCPPLDEADARAYADATWARMSNPFLVHRLADIAKGAEAKWKIRLLPTRHAYQARFGTPPPRIQACYDAFVAGGGTQTLV